MTSELGLSWKLIGLGMSVQCSRKMQAPMVSKAGGAWAGWWRVCLCQGLDPARWHHWGNTGSTAWSCRPLYCTVCTCSLKQPSWLAQQSGWTSPLLPIFTSSFPVSISLLRVVTSLLHHFCQYCVLEIPISHYYMIITYYYGNNGLLLPLIQVTFILLTITSVIASLLIIITAWLLRIKTVRMRSLLPIVDLVSLLPIIARSTSIIGNNGFIITYYWLGQLADAPWQRATDRVHHRHYAIRKSLQELLWKL